ncbi:hypothetical protein [Streptomyces africanus]|uniref:hypothetical protein n=1 Tax=Streptomyces africanus TaxID=231024 RepID=UPI0013020CF1
MDTGYKWRALPEDFPPWRTCYGYDAGKEINDRKRHLVVDTRRITRRTSRRSGQPASREAQRD